MKTINKSEVNLMSQKIITIKGGETDVELLLAD
jgi:hypothetical protein